MNLEIVLTTISVAKTSYLTIQDLDRKNWPYLDKT